MYFYQLENLFLKRWLIKLPFHIYFNNFIKRYVLKSRCLLLLFRCGKFNRSVDRGRARPAMGARKKQQVSQEAEGVSINVGKRLYCSFPGMEWAR